MLKRLVGSLVEICLRLLDDFPSFCVKDGLIYFRSSVPKKIGIGMSMGVASRLSTNNKTLDYSGRPLNLASRLMDKARPSGIVLDSTIDINFLRKPLRKRFRRSTTSVRGIHADTPIEVCFTRDVLLRTNGDVAVVNLKTQKYSTTLADIMCFDSAQYVLNVEPIKPKRIRVQALLPKTSPTAKDLRSVDVSGFEYAIREGRPTVEVRYLKLRNQLRSAGLTNRSRITIMIAYPVSL